MTCTLNVLGQFSNTIPTMLQDFSIGCCFAVYVLNNQNALPSPSPDSSTLGEKVDDLMIFSPLQEIYTFCKIIRIPLYPETRLQSSNCVFFCVPRVVEIFKLHIRTFLPLGNSLPINPLLFVIHLLCQQILSLDSSLSCALLES